MSIKLLSAAWDLKIGSTEKMVLMSLCDFANEQGVCWPSVATICRKTSKSERTVQTALKWLKDNGYFTVEGYNGVTPRYCLDPRKICTPAEVAPPQISRDTPADSAPNPRKFRTQTLKEPPKNPQPARKALEGKTLIPENWTPPTVHELPPKAQACAKLWSEENYETHAEAFHGYWRSCRRQMGDWRATWANRVIALHSQVMRDQKYNHGAPKLGAPVADGTAAYMAERYG